eukprot:TRINITY_DN6708_c0_g1_i1.p1 TRINITY_DN6708_c0_g1~~TRINITY_DN6708_c0_g1_i1.p1  ORF type:complete len:145 (-),score=25.78 TRINITY_DN6708_c0_g1_i1:72-506(-)
MAWRAFETKLDTLFARTGMLGTTRLIGGKTGEALDKNPVTRWFNNVLNVAPLAKWGLSVMPLYGVFTGKPAAKDLDLNQSLALTFTGAVWTYYALIITPRSELLCAVNLALFSVNGYNVYRKMKYDRDFAAQQAALPAPSAAKI